MSAAVVSSLRGPEQVLAVALQRVARLAGLRPHDLEYVAGYGDSACQAFTIFHRPTGDAWSVAARRAGKVWYIDGPLHDRDLLEMHVIECAGVADYRRADSLCSCLRPIGYLTPYRVDPVTRRPHHEECPR